MTKENIEIVKEEVKGNKIKKHFKKHGKKYGFAVAVVAGVLIAKKYGDLRESKGFERGWDEGEADVWMGLRNNVYFGMISIKEHIGVNPFGWTIDNKEELRELIEMSGEE